MLYCQTNNYLSEMHLYVIRTVYDIHFLLFLSLSLLLFT